MDEQSNDDIEGTLHNEFDSLANEIEELIDSKEIEAEIKPKELSNILTSFSLPYTNKTLRNELLTLLLSLNKKTKLESFMALLQKTKLKNEKMINLLISSFFTLLNILCHTKKEDVTIPMLKYIIANKIYVLSPNIKQMLVHFLDEKCKVVPSYLETLISIIEKNQNIYTIFICGLTLQVKTLSPEQKTKLSTLMSNFFENKIFDDEQREDNIILERMLVEFLSFIDEAMFYERIIPKCNALLLRSSKNMNFISTLFEGLTQHKYKQIFINQLFEEYNSFFFRNEYSDLPYKSFASIIQANTSYSNQILDVLNQMEFSPDKSHCYLSVINYIITILETRNAQKTKVFFTNKEIFRSLTYILSNLTNAENLKSEFDPLLERLIDALILNHFKATEQIDSVDISKYNEAIDDLISNTNISNSHCYLFLIISITMEKYSIIPEGKASDAIVSYINKNMSIDLIDENNKRNILPLSSLILGLINNKSSVKSFNEYLNKTLIIISNSNYLLNSYYDLNRFDTTSLYLIMKHLLVNTFQFEDSDTKGMFYSQYLRIISRILFHSSRTTTESIIISDLFDHIFKNNIIDFARQLLDFIFLFVFSFGSNDKTLKPKISFQRISDYLIRYLNVFFDSMEDKEFIKVIVLLHIPNMNLDVNTKNHRQHNTNKLLERIYSNNNPHKEKFIERIGNSIKDIAQFLFSDLGIFNQTNKVMVNGCYELIDRIFKWTKAGHTLLLESFGKLDLDKYTYVDKLIQFYQKELDYFTKFELIDLIEDIKKIEKEYQASYSFENLFLSKESDKEQEEKTIESKSKKSKAKGGKHANNKQSKQKDKDKEKEKGRIDDETLLKEQHAFINNYLYSLSNHLVFVLNRLQPVFNLMLNQSLFKSKDNIQFVLNKLWKLLQSSIASPAIKYILIDFFKKNNLTTVFSKEFAELMYLQINHSNQLFNDAIEANPSLISKFNRVLSEQLSLIKTKPKYVFELFEYYGFIIIKILFYIILNDQINQDDTIASVENLILILNELSNINYEELTVLLISLLKTNYSNDNLHTLLSIHLSKSSEKEFILLCNEILEYEYIAKTTLLKIINELNLISIKKYQSIQYKLFVLLYEDNDVVADLACIIWNKFNLALSDSFTQSKVFALAFSDHKEKDSINLSIRSYVHLKPHTLDNILSQYKSFYETEVEQQQQRKEEDDEVEEDKDKDKEKDMYIPKRHILLDFINETLELFSNEKKKKLLDYLMQVSDKEFIKEIFSKTNITIFNIIHSIEDKNIIENILASIESQLEQTNSKDDQEINYNNLRIILMMLNSILVNTLHDEKFNKRKEMIFDSLLRMGKKISNREILYLIYKNIEYVSCDLKEKSEKSFNEIIERLSKLSDSMVNYGDIYILGGLIKCFGISSYKTKGIDQIILSNMEKKKSNSEKINAMYMITILFETLKKLYEPYFVQIFNQICELIADKENKVREKAQECLKGMMKEISGYGVNQIMPSLIKDLHIINWKSKVANIEILGQFAFCAPKQLTIYIPKVIKEIMQVLKDPHPKVQETAVSVLHDIASAIKNPEIVEISPILINAIANPFEYSNNALDALLETEFKHYLDPPSLALIIPIIDYNLKSQNDQLKRKSSHVIGSIQMLVSNPNDLVQYSDIIVPNLKNALFDSNPSCRNSIAKAIGAISKSLGKSYLEDMLKWIVTFLEKDSETVQRSGAAQAYAEIIVSFGEAYLDKCFVHLISKIQEKDPIVIEGYLSIFVFLPGCLGDKFEKYFGLIFPLIIEGFSNDSEHVRNVSNKILEICIKLFARKNTKQLIDPLVSRLFDPNWRIRNSSIALVKTLIMNLNKEFFKETSDYFQKEQRDQILTMTFILKSDQCGNTGTIANMIWRDYVDNIPKYLSKVLVLIYEQIIDLFSSKQDEGIEIAECSVKLLASKFSDKFFLELIPVIRETLIEKKDQERIVEATFYILIVAVSEISEKLLTSFKDKILRIINENLFTQFSSVRKQIAIIIYEISKKLNDHHLNRTLIYNVMKQARGKPCDEQKKILEIVAALVEISKGEVINYAIGEIFRKPYEEGFLELGTMISEQIAVYYNETFEIKNLYGHLSEAFYEFPAHTLNTIVSITEKLEEGSLPLFIDFLEKIQSILEVKVSSEQINSKTAIEFYFSEILVTFCNMTQQKVIDIFPSLVERATLFLVFPNEEITKNVGIILKNLVEKTDKSPDVDTIIKSFINSLEAVNKRLVINHSDEEINALFISKFKLMIENLLYVIQNGLLYGNEKELACDLINHLITYSEKPTLKPFIMKIVGPIIRILSEKITPQIKENLMDNIKALISKSKEDIKNISPQLQSVLLKTLTDTSTSTNCERYQIKAGENIIRLLQYYPRADVTANDLLKSITNKIENKLEINAIFEMEILSDVIRFYGQVLKPATLNTHFSTIEGWISTYPQIAYDAIIVLLSCYTAHLPNKKTELKLTEESHQKLLSFITLFNSELSNTSNQFDIIANMKSMKKDDAIILLRPLGKIINKYRSYLEFNEEQFEKILHNYEETVKLILLNTNLLTPTKEIPDANLCLFLLSLGNMNVYEDNELRKKVFAYILKLIELSKLNLQLLVSCLSLIILKEIKPTPDRDEIMMKLEEITSDEKEIEAVNAFLKKIYYVANI